MIDKIPHLFHECSIFPVDQEYNLSDKPFKSLSDVEEYAENTASSINYLVLESMGKTTLQDLDPTIQIMLIQ